MVEMPAAFWTHTASVYTAGTSGTYTVLAREGLPVRLAVLSLKGTTSLPERTELAALRRLSWGPEYQMPAHAQVEIGGERWNVVEDTVTAHVYPPTGQTVRYSADVVRAE